MTDRLRRHCLLSLLAAPCTAWAQTSAPLRSIAVIDLDFVDDHPRNDEGGAQAKRIAAAHLQLQRALSDAQLYRVLDLAPARPLLQTLRGQQAFIHRCADCAQQVGRRLGAEMVMTTWVQKVSELILNFNVEVHDVAKGAPILTKSVDMRGNNDESWQRAVAYLVRDMAERRRSNPRYGT